MRTIAAATALLLALTLAVRAADGDDLTAIELKRSTAIAAHDNAFLNNLYADDFRGLTALGFEVDKATLLQVFTRDDPNTRFLLDEIKPRLFGDMAVVTGRLTGRDKQGAIISQSRYMHVYVRREGTWKLVAGQGTVIPPERRS